MKTSRPLQSLFQRFLEKSLELAPHEGSELGLHEYDAMLGRNDAPTHERMNGLMRDTLRELENLSAEQLGADDWLDRRGLLAHLRTGLLQGEELQRWRNNPQIHCDAAIQAIFGLVVRHTENLAAALPAIESRLSKLPGFLEAGASCIRKPVPLWTRLAVQSCEGAIEFLQGLGKQLPSVHPKRTASLIANACGAFRSYARTISNRSPGASGGFAIGRERFEFLIRERLGLPYSINEAEALGRGLVAQLGAELKKEAARFGRRPAAEILEEARSAWKPQRPTLLEEYTAVTETMRQRFVDADLVSMPESDVLKVLPVPEFLRHQFPTAAYSQPGPYEKKQVGIFWVNDLSLGQSEPARKQAEIAQHYGLELTCAHEGYPGHHLQFVTQNAHPSKARRMFAHSIYYEGWTLWCERMCVDHGIYQSPYARLTQLHDALWRAWRIVIDCGLHSGRLSHAGASRELVEGVGFTKARAMGDVNWYTSAPTVPMSYLLGRLELEKLHGHLTRTGWSTRQFNDWALSFGALPWSWIWQSQLR